MIDAKEEFRRYMKAIEEPLQGSVDEHPDEKQLVAYVKSALGEAERVDVERHLADCAQCREALKDMSDFFEPAREGEENVGEIEVARAWRALERRLGASQSGGGRRGGSSWIPSSSMLALAASLMVSVGLGAWVYLTLTPARMARVEPQTSTSQLPPVGVPESQVEALEARLRELEAQNRVLQERSARVETENLELRQPRANAPIFDLFSSDWVERSGGEAQVLEVRVPPDARNYVLVLTGEGQETAGEHVLEILDERGAPVWRGSNLKRDEHGNFVLTLDRSFLRDGEYRFVLYSKSAGKLVRVTDYRVRVKSR